MRGVKVQGYSSLVRSSSCPGLIISTDHVAGQAALKQRQQAELRENTVTQQAAKIESLEATIKMMAEQLGIELPVGGQDGDTN